MLRKKDERTLLYRIESVLFGLLILACLGIILWRLFGDPVVRVTGGSMNPTYVDGDLLKCKRHVESKDIARDDVIVLSLKENPKKQLIKRIIGLPGESVLVSTAGVFINGELLEETYDLPLPSFTKEETVLGENEYYVLGDNRNNSKDSRSFGPVSIDEIKYEVTGYSKIMDTFLYRMVERFLQSAGEEN